MSTILKTRTLKLVTEFWPFGLDKAGTSAQIFLKILRDAGFELFNMDEWKMTIAPASVENLLATYTIKKKNYTNLLWVRDESVA
jgi:hypothetical protein